MVLAYDYPLLSILVSVVWFFLWVIWLLTLFHVLADIFRSHDLGGGAKTLWLVFVLFFPFLGVFAYVVVRGDHMTEHAPVAEQMAQLSALHAQGILTDEDYAAAKARVLA